MPQKVNPFTIVDLRLKYKRDTGDINAQLMGLFNKVEYIAWLEEKLLKHIELKRKLIPWEPLN